ncbi:GNAT family N-acetyltransferase [Aggregatimonas sangjinii]|uniref:GNAT family N-acetyltransferase n=1 Tax=Aggregatimonas sangjinii TaxID=2583587 RepID=A0A5B7SPQ9_9FLAO|nr:GNAT family N-acetyltransferase [Aggregatimonas sangjinii]QCW98982.1 GNAT family N-acetyltransferase [Aggregatimonas sangjinii]
MSNLTIKMAIGADSDALTQLTIRSKAHWGYGERQIEAWRDELTLTEAYIENNHVYKLLVDTILVGFYAYNAENETDVKLHFLFIEPDYIGVGYGKILLLDFLDRIKNSKFKRVLVDSDPHAEKFYAKFGFKVIGQLKSTIKHRFLPIMELRIEALDTRNSD